MSKRPSHARKTFKGEVGDASAQCLKRTIILCAAGLVGVLLFALTPRKAPTPQAAAGSQESSGAPAGSFDRQSLSTKSR